MGNTGPGVSSCNTRRKRIKRRGDEYLLTKSENNKIKQFLAQKPMDNRLEEKKSATVAK